MKAVIQRVSEASVSIDGEIRSQIKQGFLVLLGVGKGDSEAEADILASKIAKMRIFCDENDKMNLSLSSVGGELLVISNFTLLANCVHGNRPDYFGAEAPERANMLYEYFVEKIRNESGVRTVTGEFGADMKVSILNDGPVTIVLDTDELKKRKA